MLIDNFGRRVTNLRIVLTRRCNLKCFYCHKEGENSCNNEIPAERVIEIIKAFYDLGIKKLKFTGGEPLLRKDLFDILCNLPKFEEVSMTTNGILLEEVAAELKECGLDRVNVSLDTLDDDKFLMITGQRGLRKVLSGIEEACNVDLTPVKINMVVMKNVNDNEIDNMLTYSNSFNKKEIKAILQLIELLPYGELKKYYLDISEIEKRYESIAYKILIRSMHHRKQYWTSKGIIEFVKPIDNTEFCLNCNRIRLTSDGNIKLCLLSNEIVKLEGLHGRELKDAIKRAVMLRRPKFASLKSFL